MRVYGLGGNKCCARGNKFTRGTPQMTAGINASVILTYVRTRAGQLNSKCLLKDDLSISTLSLKNGLPCIETQTG